ncbi:MAG: DMT family transporter [Bacteroidaceae bacterium]|jgi:drug/metabolite transporter (DMT)-like permease|nr:DMT family transporter [Bacteroidaceae bacterium]MEE0984293.1 DMT family transporter [Bacteroidaceae bacterium]
MWILFAFVSATLLGFYDVFKKQSLRDNAVLTVLLLNCLFSSIIFLPMIWYAPFGGWEVQKYIVLKAFIVLSSWICGYYAMKHLPLTIVGPVNASRPMLVLLGAMFIFGERLNLFQWTGVLLALSSFLLLKLGGKKEGIDFMRNRWALCLIAAALLGACSGLYDKYLMSSPEEGGLGLNRLTVQSYFNFYQLAIMFVVVMLERWKGQSETSFKWRWTIPFISLFICAADLAYFYSLSLDDAMISVVSMVRRGSVIVSFMMGAFLFHEKNLKSKAVDLVLVLLGMLFLYLGTVCN